MTAWLYLLTHSLRSPPHTRLNPHRILSVASGALLWPAWLLLSPPTFYLSWLSLHLALGSLSCLSLSPPAPIPHHRPHLHIRCGQPFHAWFDHSRTKDCGAWPHIRTTLHPLQVPACTLGSGPVLDDVSGVCYKNRAITGSGYVSGPTWSKLWGRVP